MFIANPAAEGSYNRNGTVLGSSITGPGSASLCYDIMLVTSLGRNTSMPSNSAAASTCEGTRATEVCGGRPELKIHGQKERRDGS
jgi:hypothetical protein